MDFCKKEFKMIAIDLDETMLHKGVISPEVIKTLTEIADNGIEIVIATGRSLTSTPKSVLKLPFLRYAVTSSGACVYDLIDAKKIGEFLIEPDVAVAVIKATNKAALMSVMYHKKIVLPITAYLKFKLSGEFKAFRKEMRNEIKSRKSENEFRKSTKITLSLAGYVKRHPHHPEKFNMRFSSVDKLSKASKALEQLAVEAVSTMGLDLEVTAKGVTKALGLQVLCEHLSLTPQQIIAIGDSGNDFEMLELAGYSIVMGNADENIRKIADKIAPDVKDDGLATVLRELFGLD